MDTKFKNRLKDAYYTGKQVFIQDGNIAPERYSERDEQDAFATGFKDAHALGCLSIMFGRYIGFGLVALGFLGGLAF